MPGFKSHPSILVRQEKVVFVIILHEGWTCCPCCKRIEICYHKHQLISAVENKVSNKSCTGMVSLDVLHLTRKMSVLIPLNLGSHSMLIRVKRNCIKIHATENLYLVSSKYLAGKANKCFFCGTFQYWSSSNICFFVHAIQGTIYF